ncbi:MAG: hypothetical protein ABIR23_04530 [Novosphingobium sp.]
MDVAAVHHDIAGGYLDFAFLEIERQLARRYHEVIQRVGRVHAGGHEILGRRYIDDDQLGRPAREIEREPCGRAVVRRGIVGWRRWMRWFIGSGSNS